MIVENQAVQYCIHDIVVGNRRRIARNSRAIRKRFGRWFYVCSLRVEYYMYVILYNVCTDMQVGSDFIIIILLNNIILQTMI